MYDFLRFFEEKTKHFPMHLSISYNKTCDWTIHIYKKGCAKDYPDSPSDGDNAVIVYAQDCDMELCFAKAHVQLKEWLCEHDGGY